MPAEEPWQAVMGPWWWLGRRAVGEARLPSARKPCSRALMPIVKPTAGFRSSLNSTREL